MAAIKPLAKCVPLAALWETLTTERPHSMQVLHNITFDIALANTTSANEDADQVGHTERERIRGQETVRANTTDNWQRHKTPTKSHLFLQYEPARICKKKNTYRFKCTF